MGSRALKNQKPAPKPPGVMEGLMALLILAEAKVGHPIDYMKHLDPKKESFSAREVANAIGKALTEHGIPNNFEKETTTCPGCAQPRVCDKTDPRGYTEKICAACLRTLEVEGAP